MSLCPICRTHIRVDTESCINCGAIFATGDLSPIEDEAPLAPPEKTSAAGLIVKIGVASVLIPAAGFLIGLILTYVIPGCYCDEGAGCGGCGANNFVAFILFGGFVGGLAAFLTILPLSLILAAIVELFSKNGK